MLRIYFFDPIDQVLGDGRIVCSTSGRVLKKTGDRVSSGEIIGYAGGEAPATNNTQNIFEFELWQNGTPIDPERFIVF